jgi:hypothetical protein
MHGRRKPAWVIKIATNPRSGGTSRGPQTAFAEMRTQATFDENALPRSGLIGSQEEGAGKCLNLTD